MTKLKNELWTLGIGIDMMGSDVTNGYTSRECHIVERSMITQ